MLNVYDFWVLYVARGAAPLPLTKKKICIWWSQNAKFIQALFLAKFLNMILGCACPLALENFAFNFGALKMLNFRPFLVLIYQYDLGVFYAHLHKKILQFTAKSP